MHTLKLSRLATLYLTTQLLVSAQPAAACSPAYYGIYCLSLREGVPDERGEIDGHSNLLRSGEDIVFGVGACRELCGRQVTMTLRDQMENEIPVTFEPIPQSTYWRVHPLQPLAAGNYTLTYTGSIESQRFSEVKTYVFSVEGEASAPAPRLRVTSDGQPSYEVTGQRVACAVPPDTCGFVPSEYTQLKTFMYISSAADEALSDEQSRSYLFRVLLSADPSAAQSTPWDSYSLVSGVLKKLYADAPETCFVAQALRVSDGAVTSSEPQCLKFTANRAVKYPVPFRPCKMTNPTAYARAWCEDNREACAPGTSAPMATELEDGCASYPEVCAPLLGKRAAAQGECSP